MRKCQRNILGLSEKQACRVWPHLQLQHNISHLGTKLVWVEGELVMVRENQEGGKEWGLQFRLMELRNYWRRWKRCW